MGQCASCCGCHSGLGYRSTAEQASDGVDLTGKVTLVTGANSGIGFETARVLALRNARVYVCARNMAKAEGAIAELRAALAEDGEDSPDLRPLVMNLSSLAAVRAGAEAFLREEDSLDILVNNAGIGLLPKRLTTDDGLEMQVGVNHVAHQYLTTLLKDALVAGAPSRVVFVSSFGHSYAKYPDGPLAEEDLLSVNDYGPMVAYGRSKTGNIWCAQEMWRRWGKDSGVKTVSINPGSSFNTNGARNMTCGSCLMLCSCCCCLKNLEQVAATQVFAATHDDVEGGLYYSSCAPDDTSDLGRDADKAVECWDLTEAIIARITGDSSNSRQGTSSVSGYVATSSSYSSA